MARRRRGGGFDSTLSTLVGITFVNRVTATDKEHAPLRIGEQVWSTHQLASQLGVVHTRAARLLTQASDSIGAKNVADLYKRSTPYTLAGIGGLGETTLYVLWRLFESQGLDPDLWAMAGDATDAIVSFNSLKKREQAAEARTQRAARQRSRANRSRSHEAAVAAVTR